MADTLFELKQVYYSYLGKIPALCAIDLSVEKGLKVAVIGANGSGKSTLLHILNGLIFPERGTIKAFGRQLSEDVFNDGEFSQEFRRRVGLVFQNSDVQLFCPTVEEDIVFGPLQLGFSREKIERRLEEITETLNLKDLLQRSPHQLSVGEKRKVAIASVLAVDPEVLLLDEPTAGLDPGTTRCILDMILLAHEQGKTIVSATHDLHVLQEVSELVFVLSQDKRIVKTSTPLELLRDERFLEQYNLIHSHSHRHKDRTHCHSHEHLNHHSP